MHAAAAAGGELGGAATVLGRTLPKSAAQAARAGWEFQ